MATHVAGSRGYATLSFFFAAWPTLAAIWLRHQAIDIEQVFLQAIVVRKFVRKTEALDRRRSGPKLVNQDVCDRAAETADPDALLHRHDQLGIAGKIEDGRLIERLDRVKMDHGGVDAILGEKFGSRQRIGGHHPRRHQNDRCPDRARAASEWPCR